MRGSHDYPGAKTLEKVGKKPTVLNPERELEDPTLMGISIVSSRNGATDPTAIRSQNQGSKKSPLSDGDSAEATDTIMNGASETHPSRGEETITRR